MTRRVAIASLIVAAATGAPLGGSASAATATTKPAKGGVTDAKTAGFCAQLKLSQQTMGSIPASATDRFARVATEWKKLEGAAPSAIKAKVTLIRGAYEKAARLKGAAATAALSPTASAAGAVRDFATKNCPAGRSPGGERGGPGGSDDGRFAEIRACLEAQGVTLPGRGERGGDGAGAPPSSIDATTQKAFEACGFTPGEGGPGGFGGRGGGARELNSPELVACLKKAGVTLPSVAQGQRPQLDDKVRAALRACREQLGLGDPGGRGTERPATTVKA